MTFTHATPRTAWSQRGRLHALAGAERQAPSKDPERRWYLDGYKHGKTEKLRREAETREDFG